ncbi:MAG TPA: hypothetical protein PLJ21_13145, partial [Pseudobdellovibrionaceae bacterium]|nr:hypothetical protein [Pseudobdellovibrionaceae bacterium]
LSLGALILFGGLAHLYIPISLALSFYLSQRFKLSKTRTFFLFALGHSLFERIWPSIFPWNLGYTLLYGNYPAFQLADLIGFEGLSTLILLLNAGVAVLWMNYKENIETRLSRT